MMNFTNSNQTVIIGIDHGYGNCKTRNFCFRSGVAAYGKEPTFKENIPTARLRICTMKSQCPPSCAKRIGRTTEPLCVRTGST